MKHFDRKSLSSENRRLKNQLEVARHELDLIKKSKAYNASRLLGQAKKQFKQSPVGFTKKTFKRVINGSLRSNTASVHKNLALIDDLQGQYQEWLAYNEPDITELNHQKQLSDKFSKQPLISIITPVFNPPVDVFEDLIRSVQRQTYPKWELCLGNFGDDENVKELLEKYAKADMRIRYLPFTENKGIAENSNQILQKAKGDYIALLDHDDTLSPDALFENVKLLNEDDYDFIYSDKDKIDEQGRRFEPFFKPDWSPEIMLNANYLTHLNVMKTSIVRSVGAWSSDTDGAQDWDLFLKVISASKKIGHIPKVLYHWRVIATSTALSIETKPYALKGQRNAVDKYLKKMGLPAKSYHHGAELLLEWDKQKSNPVCIVKSNSSSHLQHWLAHLQKHNPETSTKFVVFHTYNKDKISVHEVPSLQIDYVRYEEQKYAQSLLEYLNNVKVEDVIFLDDRLGFGMSENQVSELRGWLNVHEVLAVSPRVVDQNNYGVDCGGLITKEGIKPIFVGSAPYHQAAIGNIEWVRDLSIISPLFFVAKKKVIEDVLARVESGIPEANLYTYIQLQLSGVGRLVFDPKVMIHVMDGAHVDMYEYYEEVELPNIYDADPYMNINLSSSNPMMLAKIVQDGSSDDEVGEIDSSYHYEAMVHAANRTLSQTELQENFAVIKKTHAQKLEKVRTALFILPDFQAIYAGLNNIFSFANYLQCQGIRISFGIMAEGSLDRQKQLITDKYPLLGKEVNMYSVSHDAMNGLPSFDLAICTQWATAYLLAVFNKTKRKCYFIQDKEASFYPKGSISALVEFTYSLGFYGLANTQGLLDWYMREFNGQGLLLKSVIDLSAYNLPSQPRISTKPPYKVFFYARPNEPRNAFELAISGLLNVKKRLGNKLEIYAAGADWDAGAYGLQDSVINMGRISYDKLPAFYRSMDAGMMFMFSGHPGVVASELMASGCPVVVNQYDDITWNELYSNEETCLVSAPTADAIGANLYRILTDTKLRSHIIPQARKKAVTFYGDYKDSCDKALQELSSKLN